MKLKIFLLISSLILIPEICLADKPINNFEYTKYSSNKKFYIKMIPEDNFSLKGQGIAYEVKPLIDRIIWKVDWYSKRVELSNNGNYLVRYGPWASNFSDLALSFYKKGVLLKEYKIEDLVKDKTKVEHTASHFFWEGRNFQPCFSEVDKYYSLSTIDDRLYMFDLDSGEIFKVQIDFN